MVREVEISFRKTGTKKPGKPGFLVPQSSFEAVFCKVELLDFGFLVHDVLANRWVKLFHFKFASHGALVFGRGVEVSSARRGHEFDFFSHESDSD